MVVDLNDFEIADLKRAIVIAMQQLDSTGKAIDMRLSGRLENIKAHLEEHEN